MTRSRIVQTVGAALAACGLVLLATAEVGDAAPRRTLEYGFPQDVLETFEFELSRTTSTEFVHLPSEAQRFDVDSLRRRVDEVTTRVEGRLERVVARVFRDFSLGLVTRLVDVAGTIERAGESGPLDLSVAEGKSVSFRVLPSGELLDSSGWSRLAGAGRSGTLFEELFLQTVMRLPRNVLRGDQVEPTSYRMRVPLDPFLLRDQTWLVRFEAADAPPECGRRCVAVAYRGEITAKALDKHPARPMRAEGAGKVEGTIVLSRKKRLMSHEFVFDWDRTVQSERSNGTLRGEVRQVERVEGAIRAVSP